MRRLGAYHSHHITFGSLDNHAMSKHDLVKPATQRDELDETLFGDLLDHEADFIHVPGKHNAWRIRCAWFLAKQAANFILGDFTQSVKILADNGPNWGFVSRYPIGLG